MRLKRNQVALLALTWVVYCCGSAATATAATNYYVATDGDDGSGTGAQVNPWRTIQHAVDQTVTGDEIWIGEGVYTENVTIPKGTNNLLLRGGYNTNDWSWDPAGNRTIIAASNTANDVITFLSQENALSGLILTGGRYGLYGEGDKDIAQCQFVVSHCVISNNTSHGIYLPANRAKNGVIIRNCLIATNGGNGVYVNTSSAQETALYNCTIVDNGGHGHYDQNPNHAVTRIKNCIITGNTGYGVWNGSSKFSYVGYSCVYSNGSGNFLGVSLRLEAGVISAPPGYIATADYRLGEESPCIDRGTDLSGQSVTNDLELTAWSLPYDMGCFQSDSNTAPLFAATFADASQPDDSGVGTNWGTAKHSIGAAIAVTAPGGTCTVASGTYDESLAMPPNITVSGTNQHVTILSNLYDIVSIPETNSTVKMLSLIAGRAGVIITGGGTNSRIENCIMRGNTYGVYAPSVGINRRFTLEKCILTNNTGTAVYMPASGGKGAINVRNCLIADNGGDGIFVQMNSIYESYVYNCTIVSNTGSGWRDEATSHKTTYYKNCIITDNGGYGIRHNSGSDSYVSYSDVNNNTLGNFNGAKLNLLDGILQTDPGFNAPGDFHLRDGSLCVDAGEDLSGEGVTNDLEGIERLAPFDMGCYQSPYTGAVKYADTYVDVTRPDNSGAGTNWLTSKQTIAAALPITASYGTCHLATGLYAEAVILAANITLEGVATDATIISNAGTVVSIQSTNTVVRNITVLGGNVGIYVKGGGLDDVLIDACLIRDNTTGISSPEENISHRYVVNRCRIINNSGDGINMNVGANGDGALDLRNSLIASNGNDGIYIREASPYETLVYNCTIVDNGRHGYVDESTSHKTTHLKNCIVSGNGGYGVRHTGNQTDYIYNSCIYDNALGPVNGNNVTTVGDNIAANPLFVGSSDYRLQDGSPCVDGGIDLSGDGITNDLSGTLRAAPFDMGCYESAFSAAQRFAATYVDGGRPDDEGAGTNWATAKQTIGSALAVTADGVCSVAVGSYFETLFIPANVELVGEDRYSVVVSSSWNIVEMPQTNCSLRRLTLANGLWGVNITGSGIDDKYIDECTIVSNTYGVCDITAGVNRRFVIQRSIVRDNTSHGIRLDRSTTGRAALIARNCLVVGNGGDGIFIRANSGVKSYIDYCTISDNGGSGYRDYAGSHKTTSLTNCIITGNSGYGIRHDSVSGDDYVGYSCVYSNALGDLSGSRLVAGAGMITNSLPLFDVDGDNPYLLTDGSPCVGTAVDIGITNDLLDVERPIRYDFDMGAFEFNPPPGGTVFLFR